MALVKEWGRHFCIGLITGIFLSVSGMSSQSWAAGAKAPLEDEEITVETFLEWQRTRPVLVVDVRTEWERRQERIPGAISAEEFESQWPSYRDSLPVVYCASGSRSAHYVQSLAKRGIRAYSLKDGIWAWKRAGQEVISG